MVRLICYNIEYCEGIEGLWYQYLKFWRTFFPPKRLDERIVAALKEIKPDILALVEVDIGSFRSRGKDEVRFIEEKLGMKDFVEKIKYPWQGWLRLFHHVPIMNKQANALISKYQISKVIYHVLHEGTKRVVIEAKIHVPEEVTLLLVHLARFEKAREKQLEELVRMVNAISTPVILMGDFNTYHGEREIKQLLKETRLRDRVNLDKHSRHVTLPVWHPSKRLDYILTSLEIKVHRYSVLHFHFSDHLPLLVDFTVRKKTGERGRIKKMENAKALKTAKSFFHS